MSIHKRNKLASALKAARSLRQLSKVANWEREDALAAIPLIGPALAAERSDEGEGLGKFFASGLGQMVGAPVGTLGGLYAGGALKDLFDRRASAKGLNAMPTKHLLAALLAVPALGTAGTMAGGAIGSRLSPDRETFSDRLRELVS
jgi:hypothetical protein